MSTSLEQPETSVDASLPSIAHLDTHLLRIIAGGRAPTGGPVRRAARHRATNYRRFLDALGVALYTTDADGRITFFNEAASAFWGRRPAIGEQWCGSWRLFWPAGMPMRHDECPMAIALREQREIHGGEAIAERPDGSRVHFLAYPTPLLDDRGQLLGAVNVLVDVTDRRRMEDTLRETARALETSNTVKDEFLGLVSHELRTPVTTIFGNARLLHDRGDALPPDLRTAMVSDIVEDAGRLHSIIENLLQLTRLGSGLEPDLEPQILGRVVRRSVDNFMRARPGREVKLLGGRSGVIVEAEATWLDLVVANLLANADKYSPPEEPIEVHLTAMGATVEVAVLDRGMGFDGSPDQLFAPFYRAESARARASGMGIGLTVCRRIVEVLGGRIWARAREGGGAEFGFTLPRVDAEPLH